jgi:hypothetical protein
MTPQKTIPSEGTANDPASRSSGQNGVVFAFAGTLIFYMLFGPLAGVAAIFLPAYGIQLYHVVWSNIAFYWLHTLQCPPTIGGDCMFLSAKMPLLPSGSKFLMIVAASYVVGCIPAASAGLLVALGMSAGEEFRFWHVLAFGCFVGVPFAALVGAQGSHLRDAHFFFGCAFLVYICVFATVVCWLPARAWWPQKRALNSGHAVS